MKRNLFLLILIVILAAALRLPYLDKFPNGFSGDETIQGYTAYSILNTGKDEWGEFLPLVFRSFGDFKPPLYAYLTVPSVVVFGLNEFATRLPMAIFGIASVVVVYLLTKELFKKESIALLAAFFLAVSPWHIHFSRTAFEGGLTTFLFPAGLYFYLKSLKDVKFLPLAFLFWGLNAFSYLPARLFTVLMTILIIFWRRPKLLPIRLSHVLAGIIVIFSVVFIVMSTNMATTSRFSDISIFGAGLEPLKELQFESQLPGQLARVFNNKLTFYSSVFFENYLSYFSPTFFFTGSRPDFSYLNLPGAPLLYGIDLVLLIAAFVFATQSLKRFPIVLAMWLLVAPLPAALTQVGLNANRSITFLPVFSVIATFGAVNLMDYVKDRVKSKNLKKLIEPALIVVVLLATLYFLQNYFFHLAKNPSESLRFGYKETINFTESVKDQYDKIIFSKSNSEPQAYVAFYAKVDPTIYQQHAQDYLRYEEEGKLYLDQLTKYNLGKYEFRDINWDEDKLIPDVLMVGKPEEFPENVSGVKTVHFPNGEIAFRIVESEIKTK